MLKKVAKLVFFANPSTSSRFTDFLVYEVDQQGEVVRLKSIDKPISPPPPPPKPKVELPTSIVVPGPGEEIAGEENAEDAEGEDEVSKKSFV